LRTNEPDPAPFQPLGDKVPKPVAPAPSPAWKEIRPGIWQGPDGKLATQPQQVK
jgi:hypothetical protein